MSKIYNLQVYNNVTIYYMDKKKHPYTAPQTTVSRVEIESAICGGSVDIANPNDANGKIEEQEVNTSFGGDFGSPDGWDPVKPVNE